MKKRARVLSGLLILGLCFCSTGFAISVPAQLTGISFPVQEIMLAPDETYQLTPSALPEGTALPQLSYSSSDMEVAQVQPNGMVTAINGGTAVVTAKTTSGNFSTECVVRVTKRESSQWSWLIILIEALIFIIFIFIFTLSYKNFVYQKMKKEFRQSRREQNQFRE